MKYIIFLLMLPFAASAQKATYRIDPIMGGGYYLVRTETDTTKGTTAEYPQKFNTREQITAYVGYLREQAEANKAGAIKAKENGEAEAKRVRDKAAEEARKMNEAAPILTDAAAKVEAASEAFFNPKPVPAPAPAAQPKKAKKGKKN
jgi:hypothetical protein